MSLIKLTLKLYADSLKDAVKAFGRTAWAIVVLIGFWVLLAVAERSLAIAGPIAGFVVFFIRCVLAGTYLSMVEVGVNGQRVLRPGDLSHHAWQYWRPILHVGAVFWITSFVLVRFLPAHVYMALFAAAAVVFNPVPEKYYQDQEEGFLDILGDAMNFMQRNWPEWLGALLIATVPFLGFWAFLSGGLTASVGMLTIEVFGPFLGFMELAGGLDLASLAGPWLALPLVLAPVVHFVMCFRGQLYKRLRLSNRRQRAWQSRF